MSEYFIVARSYAAPIVSDTFHSYISAETPGDALTSFAAEYGHPAGLFAAAAYESADVYHKGEKALTRWLSDDARIQEATTYGSVYR